MSNDRRPYARFYYGDFKRDYRECYADPAVLGTYVQLLSVAEASWPAAPDLPRSVRPRFLAKLVSAGLVTVSGDTYSVKGFSAERAGRSAHAATAADARWNTPGNAPGIAQPMPSTKTKSERRDAEPDDGRVDLEAFLIVTRRAPTPKQRRILDEVLDRHDLTGPAWSADLIYRNPHDPIGAVIEADKAWRAARIAEAQAAEPPKPQPRRPRGVPTATREILNEWAAQKKDSAA